MKFSVCLAAILIAISGPVSASQFTYDFNTPIWSVNPDTSLYGTGLNLSITVDNGSTSDVSQQYAFSDIVKIAAKANGGTFSSTFVPPATYIDTPDGISTDAAGIPTLHIGTQGNTANWQGSDLPSYDTLALYQATIYNYDAIRLSTSAGGDAYINSPQDKYGNYVPIDIAGSEVSPVPLPPAWILALSSLGLLGLTLMGSDRTGYRART